VNEGKFKLTSSELVLKVDEIKFECMISPKGDVIGRMKIRKVKFSQKSGMSKFRARVGGKFRCMYVKRRKASVLVTPVTARV